VPRANDKLDDDDVLAESESKKKKGRKKYASFAEAKAALSKSLGAGLFDSSPPELIPTRFWRLGMFLGGGIPAGRIVELWGPPGGWKTTSSLVMLGDVQRHEPDRHVFFVDFEQTFPQEYAAHHGCFLDDDHVVRPRCLDEGYDIALTMIETGEVSAIAFDSVVAIASQAQLNKPSVSDELYADRARVLSKFLNEATPLARLKKCTLLCLNQMRVNIGGGPFANPEKRPGGKAFEHLAAVILRCSAKKDGAQMIIVKNKITGKERRKFLYGATDGEGIDLSGEFLAYLVSVGAVSQSGAHYAFGKTKVHGKKDAAVYANEHQEELIPVARECFDKIQDAWLSSVGMESEDECESE